MNVKKCKYIEEYDTMNECKEEDQTMDHLIEFPLLKQTRSLTDHIVYNDTAKDCVKQWIRLVS